MDNVYTAGPGMGSTANPPPIPGKYVGWPDTAVRPTPPPPPPQPNLSPAHRFIPRVTGVASVA